MDTVQIHVSMDEGVMDRLESLAEREGRQPYDLIRESVINLIQNREEETVTEKFRSVPIDGHPLVGDYAERVEHDDVWSDEEKDIGSIEATELDTGDVIWSVEWYDQYYDYYRWVVTKVEGENMFQVQTHARITLSVFRDIMERFQKAY